jgi:uncharacterized protein YcfL
MKSKPWKILAYTLLGLATLTGCSTTSTVVMGDNQDTRIYYNNATDNRKIGIVEVTDFRENGLLQAVVTLKNQTKRNLRVQYQFQWYNADGAVVMPDNDVYKVMVIEGNDIVPVQSIAPRPDVVEFKFKVSKVNDWKRGPNSILPEKPWRY